MLAGIGHSRTSLPLTAADKGAPAHGGEVPIEATSDKGWNLLREDILLPVAVLKDEALRGNSRWMRDFLALTGAKIAPHGKTSMAPALFDLQRRDGAWGLTLATLQQMRVAREHGFDRILLANQLVGRGAIEYVFRELDRHPDFEFFCIADSVENVGQLAEAGERLGATRSLQVMVELGFANGRTGCRTDREAMQVARAISAASCLSLCGIEGFEALLRAPTLEERDREIVSFLERIVRVAEACSSEDLFGTREVILSAGGSTDFDTVTDILCRAALDRPASIVIRSGCYLTLDSIMYKKAFSRIAERSPGIVKQIGDLKPALEVWAYVQSRPEPGLAIATLGKRDVSYDDLPVPLSWYRPGSEPCRPAELTAGHTVFRLDDQHCYLHVPLSSPLAVGDMISVGVSHPCLTFDKWRVLHRVDESYNIVGSVRTFF